MKRRAKLTTDKLNRPTFKENMAMREGTATWDELFAAKKLAAEKASCAAKMRTATRKGDTQKADQLRMLGNALFGKGWNN